jgi:uncharacterized membrane protein YdjX (TVP38/TMEM64 family)
MTRRSQVVVALLIIGIAVTLLNRQALTADALTARIAAYGAAAPLVFMFARIAGALVLVPGSVMAIVAGILFGFVPGAIYNLLSATIGAIAAFGLARFIAPNLIRRGIGNRALVDRLITGVEAEGWRFVAFLRLVPLFPYGLVNYGLGFTNIRTIPYSLATLICMIPGDLAYTYLGYAAQQTAAGNERWWQLALLALAALATLAFIPRFVRRYRQLEAEQADSNVRST